MTARYSREVPWCVRRLAAAEDLLLIPTKSASYSRATRASTILMAAINIAVSFEGRCLAVPPL